MFQVISVTLVYMCTGCHISVFVCIKRAVSLCVCLSIRAHPDGPARPVLHGSVLRRAHQASGVIAAAVLGALLSGLRTPPERRTSVWTHFPSGRHPNARTPGDICQRARRHARFPRRPLVHPD